MPKRLGAGYRIKSGNDAGPMHPSMARTAGNTAGNTPPSSLPLGERRYAEHLLSVVAMDPAGSMATTINATLSTVEGVRS